MSAMITMTLFGKVQMTRDGEIVTGFISKKAQALLIYLVLTGRSHARDELATLLWSDVPDLEAKASLRAVLSNLRQMMGAHLSIDRQRVAFKPSADVYVDVAHFYAGLQHSGPTGSEESITSLRNAIELYRGDLMEGFSVRGAAVFDEWLTVERERLRLQALQGIYMLAAHHTARGEYTAAIQYTTRLLEMEPWHEEAHRQLMLLLTLNGQRSAALMQYETCRRILASELGVEPVEETTSLYQRIRSVAWIAPQRPSPNRPGTRAGLPSEMDPLPFVGRGKEYAWLLEQFEAVRYKRGVCTLVYGEAGVGKTRLIEEVSRYMVGSGALLLRAQCQAFEHKVPYQPIIGALRLLMQSMPAVFQALPLRCRGDLARLLPELLDDETAQAGQVAPGNSTNRQRIFDAVACLFEALVNEHPAVVLFLDDLHHADAETVDLLRYLLHHLHGTAFWCIGAYRLEDLQSDHSMARLYHDLEWIQRIARLQLQALDERAIVQITDALPGIGDQQQELVAYLHDMSEGNTGILALLLQDLVQRSILFNNNGNWRINRSRLTEAYADVPRSVQALIMSRLSRLPRQARALLNLAAIIGRHFDLSTLTSAADQELGDVGEILELLLERCLIWESTTEVAEPPLAVGQSSCVASATTTRQSVQYQFAHDLFRRVIEANLSRAGFQQLHARITATQHLANTVPTMPDLRRRRSKQVWDG